MDTLAYMIGKLEIELDEIRATSKVNEERKDQEISDYKLQLSQSQAALASSEQQLQESKDRVKDLEADLAKSAAAAVALRSVPVDKSKEIKLQKDLDDANKQVASLEKEVAGHRSQISDLERRFNNERAEVSGLRDELDLLRTETSQRENKLRKELEGERSTLKSTLQELASNTEKLLRSESLLKEPRPSLSCLG